MLANIEYMMSRKVHETKDYNIGPFYYRFSIRLSLITIVAVCIFTYLGMWQIARGYEKKNLIKSLEQKSQGKPLSIKELDASRVEIYRFAPVLLQGIYLNHFTFLLDNQLYEHQVGYRVITAFQSPLLQKLILVDRGWIARTADRTVLPNIQDVYGVQMLHGLINTIPTGIVLKADEYNPEAVWPIVIQNLDYSFIARNLNHPVYEFVVQLNTANAPGAYLLPKIDFGIPSDKHFAYAMQWFLFAFLVLIYYVVHSFKRSKN